MPPSAGQASQEKEEKEVQAGLRRTGQQEEETQEEEQRAMDPIGSCRPGRMDQAVCFE
jgi:hypothetical protein